MKLFILPLILILSACSLDKNSTYWNKNLVKKSLETKKLSKISKKTIDFKTMTFDEFNLHLKNYADKADYPDINN